VRGFCVRPGGVLQDLVLDQPVGKERRHEDVVLRGQAP